MPSSRRRPTRLPLLAALALAAACGGDDGTGPGEDADASVQQPADVRITPSEVTLDFIGETVQLGAQVLSPAGLLLDRPVAWASSDPSVATVSGDGLVTARGVGSARVSAEAGRTTGFSDVTVRQLPRTLRIVSGDGQSAQVGALLEAPLLVEVEDEGGTPAAGAQLSWFLSQKAGALETSADRTDAQGRGEARWRLGEVTGAHTLQVVMSAPFIPGAPPHTASVTFTSMAEERTGPPTDEPVVLTDVAPAVLLEGDSAWLAGSGFSAIAAENSVVVDGLAASILSASDSLLVIQVPPAPCRPPRSTTLSISRGASGDTLAVEITPGALLAMAPGEGWVAPSGCLHLEAGDGTREYLVGIQSTAPSAGTLTQARLTAEVGSAVGVGGGAVAARRSVALPLGSPPGVRAAAPSSPRPPLQAAANPAEPSERIRRHRAAEARLRAREAAELERLGGLEAARWAARGWAAELHRERARALVASGPGGVAAAVPTVGDTLSIHAGTSCLSRERVQAITRWVGDRTIWLEDVGNPPGGFTTTDYQALDARYTASVQETLTDYFGTDRDLDGNGRLMVLITKSVNEQGGILGYVWSGDLFPERFCQTSNEAEIFYGIAPDPTGLAGHALPTEAARAEYPALMAHEATHVIQRSEQFFGDAGAKDRWEIEGGATLAEQLVGNAVAGLGSGRDLGWAEIQTWRDWYLSWVNDAALYFGLRGGRGTAGAPEECTWIGGEDQGNTGPCFTNRAVYGVPSLVLRWTLDRYGPAHPGGERALMREMTQSPASGYATLEEATGEGIQPLLAGFYAALWQDGRYTDALPSWDLLDIFANVPEGGRLQPHTASAPTPDLSLRIRGGSTGLLAWSAGAHPPTSLRVVTPGVDPFPSFMAAWVVRLR